MGRWGSVLPEQETLHLIESFRWPRYDHSRCPAGATHSPDLAQCGNLRGRLQAKGGKIDPL